MAEDRISNCEKTPAVRLLLPGEWDLARPMLESRLQRSAIVSAEKALTPSGSAEDEKTTRSLWGAWFGDRLVAVLETHLLPGRTAMVAFPRSAGALDGETARVLVQGASSHLLARRCDVLQMLLEDGGGEEAAAVLAAGWSHVTDLWYLFKTVPSPAVPPSGALTLSPYHGDERRLARVVEATYHGSRDCPELNGRRTTSDTLTTYRAAGQFRPQWWLIANTASHDVGCLLMNDHPGERMVEIVYMGLAPEARGRGYAQELLRHAEQLSRDNDRDRLVLAVDQRNAPAVTAYLGRGFVCWASRALFMRFRDSAR